MSEIEAIKRRHAVRNYKSDRIEESKDDKLQEKISDQSHQ